MARRRADDRGQAGVRPILKWAGGKRQLLPALRPHYPSTFKRYFEPFVGSGAVFLDLYNRRLLTGREARLSDSNADIIGCYRMVRDAVDDVIAALLVLEQGHRAGGRDHFYEVRNDRFNPERRRLRDQADPSDHYTPELAAMLIYLNRTGYNGLFRVNSRGEFNVPAGRYGAVRICDPENLRKLSSALSAEGVTLAVGNFEQALKAPSRHDFVYLDPPYAPLSRTAHFTSYTASRFGPDEQAALQRAVIGLARREVHVLLSNSFAEDISRLYEESPDARSAGLRTLTVEARRAINSRAAGRGVILEYLITNVQP